MALTTAVTILKYSTDGTVWNKLVDIITYPDFGSAPSKLDSTTLTQPTHKTNEFGLQETPDLTFEANYDKAALATIIGLAGDILKLKVEFGAAGTDGSITWDGQVAAYITGGGVDEIRKMTVGCSASTPIVIA